MDSDIRYALTHYGYLMMDTEYISVGGLAQRIKRHSFNEKALDIADRIENIDARLKREGNTIKLIYKIET